MPTDLIILIAAIAVSWFVFTWLVNVVKATVKTAVIIAIIVFSLQLFFGIGPTEILTPIQQAIATKIQPIQNLWQQIFGQ